MTNLYMKVTLAEWIGCGLSGCGEGDPIGFLLAIPIAGTPSPDFGCLLPSSRSHHYCYPLLMYLQCGSQIHLSTSRNNKENQ